MTQSETITLYTIEEAREIIIHNLFTKAWKILKTAISTVFVIAFGVAVMYFIEGTTGIFIIVVGLAFIYGF